MAQPIVQAGAVQGALLELLEPSLSWRNVRVAIPMASQTTILPRLTADSGFWQFDDDELEELLELPLELLLELLWLLLELLDELELLLLVLLEDSELEAGLDDELGGGPLLPDPDEQSPTSSQNSPQFTPCARTCILVQSYPGRSRQMLWMQVECELLLLPWLELWVLLLDDSDELDDDELEEELLLLDELELLWLVSQEKPTTWALAEPPALSGASRRNLTRLS